MVQLSTICVINVPQTMYEMTEWLKAKNYNDVQIVRKYLSFSWEDLMCLIIANWKLGQVNYRIQIKGHNKPIMKSKSSLVNHPYIIKTAKASHINQSGTRINPLSIGLLAYIILLDSSIIWYHALCFMWELKLRNSDTPCYSKVRALSSSQS